LAANVLSKGVVKPAPERFVFFSFNDGKDALFCDYVVLVLCCFKAVC
jgi:hypothetical protein